MSAGWIPTVEGWTFRNAASGSGWHLRTPEGADVTDSDGNLWTFTDIGDLVTYVATASAPEGQRGYWLVNRLATWEVRWVTDDDIERMEWQLVGSWTGTIAELEARLAQLNWPQEETQL